MQEKYQPLDRQNPKTLHIQLYEELHSKILKRIWVENQLIPSENELSRLYSVSRSTVRQVLNEMVQQGLIYRVAGKGTFVSEDKIEAKPLSYAGIREQLEDMGYDITTRVLGQRKSIASAQVQKKMNLSPNDEVFVIERLRLIQGTPLSYHVSYTPAKNCQDLFEKDLAGEQLCHIMQKYYGLSRKRIVETLELVEATPKFASLLDVKKGHGLLLLENLIFDTGDEPFEYSKVYFRGDRIKIRLEFKE